MSLHLTEKKGPKLCLLLIKKKHRRKPPCNFNGLSTLHHRVIHFARQALPRRLRLSGCALYSHSNLLLEVISSDPWFPACCQLLPGSIPMVLLAALGPVVDRDEVTQVILAHKLRLKDAGEWKYPEVVGNDVQKAVSTDLLDSCTTIRPVIKKAKWFDKWSVTKLEIK